jgi:hypothetical protein
MSRTCRAFPRRIVLVPVAGLGEIGAVLIALLENAMFEIVHEPAF